MPNPSSPLGLLTPMQSFFAPWTWLFAMPTDPDEAKIAEAGSVWGPALESQARLWSQFIDVQRKFWSFYSPLFQAAPVFMNGEAKTVAEDEVGLEPAETVDGIPDVFELQARTWNHFLDANRNFWTAITWPGNGTLAASDEPVQDQEAAAGEAPAAEPAAHPPRKKASAKHHSGAKHR